MMHWNALGIVEYSTPAAGGNYILNTKIVRLMIHIDDQKELSVFFWYKQSNLQFQSVVLLSLQNETILRLEAEKRDLRNNITTVATDLNDYKTQVQDQTQGKFSLLGGRPLIIWGLVVKNATKKRLDPIWKKQGLKRVSQNFFTPPPEYLCSGSLPVAKIFFGLPRPW